jgi:outer membrane protein OmpA-like peptidoglycan-associated protein
MSPFIHADNLNLYFSSKGHVGMGDYDLFLSNRDSITSKWQKPKNIGYPINDHKSQNSLIVSSDGKTAYFNSSFEGYGSDDIFYFDLPNNIRSTPLNNIELDIIVSKIGEEIILKNVHFSNNSYVLNDSSKIELNKLSDYLINYKIKIKIEGHTDSNGDSNLNLILSNNRAKSVNDYLISNGVKQNQLNFSGYGDTRPIADNNSKEGRAINRRTSFIIID